MTGAVASGATAFTLSVPDAGTTAAGASGFVAALRRLLVFGPAIAGAGAARCAGVAPSAAGPRAGSAPATAANTALLRVMLSKNRPASTRPLATTNTSTPSQRNAHPVDKHLRDRFGPLCDCLAFECFLRLAFFGAPAFAPIVTASSQPS
jgi:hypothetical protein